MSYKTFISGCAGTSLSEDEIDFFKTEKPWGLIVFARNIDTPEQISHLTSQFRMAVKREDAPVFIDQEGGRVRRLRPPHWPEYPAMGKLARLWDVDPEKAKRAVYLQSYLMGIDLISLGITVNCLPVLDVRTEGASDIVGDRSYGTSPDVVIALGRAAIDGTLAAGVVPVMKHMPGHGRALVDSHLELPRVKAALAELETKDFVPFKALADCPMAMTAHIVFEAIDPDNPVTQSPCAISEVLRGKLGFQGCLLSDDISMKALGGDVEQRVKLIIEAGCDMVLHCNGDMQEMVAVARAVPWAKDGCFMRANEAMQSALAPQPVANASGLRDEFEELVRQAGELT
ncbi:beta-N-acetylhexosaminidase [Pseudovibrio exalbescens]|uniref:beta-N-acetylhexosaminidase n=1 Tax=Pseudovibrio exalbescens TaxID=197461 RepID=UPI0023659EBE|nr:beta-N-acetylhexosaminidase [Pseudovibrio exalbescens]MDD7908740.1 beta-N-acetylhexosaminidase [Pseudovibrio exalbescens]